MNIDGYTLTEKMRKARRRFRFTATEQALFYELVAICNGEDWRDVFDCSNIELCFALNVNEKTLIKARESLINAGLVYYKSGKNKRVISSYSFVKEFKTSVTTTVNFTVNQTANETANSTGDSTGVKFVVTWVIASCLNSYRHWKIYCITFSSVPKYFAGIGSRPSSSKQIIRGVPLL